MALYHPVTLSSLILPGNLFLAPVAGYADRVFRSLCVEQGADFTCTELVSAEALVRAPREALPPGGKTGALLRRGAGEERYAIQLFGADPETMYKAALLLAPLHPEAVDINCGCPVPKVVKTGAGSALMKDPLRLGRVVAAVVRAAEGGLGGAPVTVKMRSGWDADSLTYREAARAAVENGAALVTLHPRTRAQGYAGRSNWSHIADLVTRLAAPVAGSGDLYSPEDAERMLRETGCAAVLFARGALGNPFIFSETRSLLLTGAYGVPDPGERLRTGFRHLCLLAGDIGERPACREMRKQFCAYTKVRGKAGSRGEPGIPGGARLRDRLVRAETIAEYQAILGL